ncbi:hypothetical protein Tco_0425025 [Tanacetum coccineum]
MSSPKFAETHNVVAFLEKPTESDGFAEIVDFLKARSVSYALTVNPIIYTSSIQQLWATTQVKTVNGVRQLQALIDTKKVIITVASIRNDLHLDDAECTDCLPNTTIFEELAKMRYEKHSQKLTLYKAFFSPQWKFMIHTITQSLSTKTTAWNEFSSTMASLIICLATNRKINISKYIFDAMVKHLYGGVKFLMYPRFLQVFINQQLGDMSRHKKTFVNPFHTKKIFANMKREGKDFSRRIPIIDQPSTSSQPKKKQKSRRKQRKGGRATLYNQVSIADIGGVTAVKIDELNLAQTLIEIKKAKPKVVTTASTTTTTTRPKAKGVVVQEPCEFRAPQEAQPSISKDKGKGIMIEPEVPLKRKDQIALDEQIARDIQAKLDAKLIEEQKLARKQEEEANIALIESWENTQAMMEADRLLAERLQSKEREELTDEEKGKLFMELMEKRRKHFAALRAQEKRNRPPTKAQKRTQMSTYLKHMGGYTYKQLKGKSFDEIQKLFDKEMKRVNTFMAMGSEVQESKEKKVEGSEEKATGSRKKMLRRKRAGKEQQQESSKKQRLEEDKESDEVEEIEKDDEDALKKYLVIKKDDDIAIDVIPLATRLLVIGIDEEDLQTLWKLFKTKHGDIRPEDEHERVLWGDLKVMFEPDIKSDVWRNLNLKIQKLNIKFRGGLLGLKRLQGHLRLLLLSTVSMKLLLPVEVKTAQNRYTGDDDNFLFTVLGSPRSVPWLGNHTESVIAAMTGKLGAGIHLIQAPMQGKVPLLGASPSFESGESQVEPIKEEEEKAAKVAAITETKDRKVLVIAYEHAATFSSGKVYAEALNERIESTVESS